MWELIRIFIPSMLFISNSEYLSTYKIGRLGEKKYTNKEKKIYYCTAIIMGIYVGLRTWYNDTVTYIGYFESLNIKSGFFNEIDWSLGANPGFELINRIVKSLGFSSQTFLMLFALFTIITYMWFIWKYSNNIWLSVYLFFTMGCYTFTMAAIKQTTAIAICLIATDKFIEKKYVNYIALIIFACTIHPYSILYLAIPFLQFRPWTNKTYGAILVTMIVGISLESLMGVMIGVTSMFGEEYTILSFGGDGVNIYREMVIWAPIALSFFSRNLIKKTENRVDSLMLNLSMLNAELMFIALFGTANYFARLANYFLLFQTIALPNLLKYFNKESKKILLIIIIICYLLYFYYANVINQPFDAQFDQTNFIEYVFSLFGG